MTDSTTDRTVHERAPVTCDGGRVESEDAGRFDSAELDELATSPTTASIALALVVTFGTVATIVWQVDGTLLAVGLGALGAVSYALSLWLLSTGARESVTTTLVSLLSLVVGGGILSSVVAATVLAVSTVFPVGERSLLSLGILVVTGHVGVVVGCVLAILGVLLGVRNLATSDTVATHSRTVGMTTSAPATATVLLVLTAVVTQAGARHPVTITRDLVSVASTTMLAPGGRALHLGTLFILVTLAAAGVRLALGQLPVTELFGDSERRQHRIDRARQGLNFAVFAGLILTAVLGLPELVLPPRRVGEMLGQSAYETVGVVSRFEPLRTLLWGVAGIGLAVAVSAWLLRRTAQAPGAAIARRVGPVGTGILVTVAAVASARRVYGWLVATIAAQLPQELSNIFTGIAETVGDVLGAPAVVVLLLTLLGVSTVLAALTFRFALFLRYISRDTAGFSLASGGLFIATVFAATIEAPLWVVLGGVIASLLVWDAGRFGTTLGDEIGTAPQTYRTELVHLGGTVLVGGIGAGLATGAPGVLARLGTVSASTATVALVFVTAGIVSLVVSLRS